MRRLVWVTVTFVACVGSVGCRGASPPEAAATAPPPASTARPAGHPSTGTVEGRTERAAVSVVVLDGRATGEKSGGERSGGDKSGEDSAEAPAENAAGGLMDQVGQTFAPEMLFVRMGQPVEFRNSDDTLHNVHVTHTETKEPAFNVAIPTGEKYMYTFKKEGFYHVGCDIHPAMSAEIFSSPTPWVTMADDRGAFSFSEVPVGVYTVRIFSRRGIFYREVEVKPGRNEIALDEGSLKTTS